ncbi:MAG: acylneuraminate cytidylyltransferase family protein [Leptospiraceae bacterium]|nr:acylneuraminate cytidylyltransferase family protein [Leptospiraceae bacterium]NUM42961.1 acylneuraminate cytidylyltransferase family protein [Leptospiraceae bacterium]
MKIFAFVFARGGSKGLPGKNIMELDGKPLLKYSIDIARSIESIEKIFVSTDDSSIANIARENGAIVIERPKTLAEDNSPEWLAWQHSIQWVTENHGSFDYFVSLPATSPLRNKEDIENSIAKMQLEDADICVAYTPANRSPYFNMVKVNEEGCLELVNKPDSAIVRRQDAPKVYDLTTVVYVSKPKHILENFGLFSGRVAGIEVPKERAVDIDDIYDFRLAEIILRESKKK